MTDERPRDDAHGRKHAVGGDLIIPAMAVGFAAYFFWSIDDLEWEARANGTVIGAILIALVVLQVFASVRAVVRGEATLGLGSVLEPEGVLGRRLALLFLLAAFVGLLPWTGATLGILVMMLLSMLLLGVRDWRILVGVSGLVAITIYVLFIAILKAKLPHGPLEKLLAMLSGLGG